MGCQELLDYTSKTWEIPRQSFRRWSPLQRLQGNFGLRVVLVGISTLSLGRVVGWDSGSSFHFFLLIFLFFFFLFTWILVLQLSTGEEGERGEDTSGKEGGGFTGGWCSRKGELTSETQGGIGITRLENKHIGNPIVNLGRLKVAMIGGPTFPNEGKTKGSP